MKIDITLEITPDMVNAAQARERNACLSVFILVLLKRPAMGPKGISEDIHSCLFL